MMINTHERNKIMAGICRLPVTEQHDDNGDPHWRYGPELCSLWDPCVLPHQALETLNVLMQLNIDNMAQTTVTRVIQYPWACQITLWKDRWPQITKREGATFALAVTNTCVTAMECYSKNDS